MVGHWGIFEEGISEPLSEVYFGEVDEEGVSSFYFWMSAALTGSEEDESDYLKYRVNSESGDTVTINYFQEGDPFIGLWNLEIVKDGQSLKVVGMEFQYIDSKTEP
jgi:hypothetical protein